MAMRSARFLIQWVAYSVKTTASLNLTSALVLDQLVSGVIDRDLLCELGKARQRTKTSEAFLRPGEFWAN